MELKIKDRNLDIIVDDEELAWVYFTDEELMERFELEFTPWLENYRRIMESEPNLACKLSVSQHNGAISTCLAVWDRSDDPGFDVMIDVALTDREMSELLDAIKAENEKEMLRRKYHEVV